jgi:hypothetical protein
VIDMGDSTNIASLGARMAVDWEQRIDFARLRAHRLGRAKASLAASELGCLLLFDPNNLRYVTSTAIGTTPMRGAMPDATGVPDALAQMIWEELHERDLDGEPIGMVEAPMISRLHSFDDPVELEVGMVFALETYCPASDGRSAARIEEEVVVTPTGSQVITRFPADELLVTGRNYVRGADFVRAERGGSALVENGRPATDATYDKHDPARV